MAAVLERIGPKEGAGECDGILEIAREELGYRPQHPASWPTEMVDVLEKAGVRPFDNTAVNKYKADKIRGLRYGPLWKFGYICAIPVAISLFLSISESPWFLFLLLIPGIIMAAGHDSCNDRSFRWNNCKLGYYSEKIPTYALQTAIDVNRAIGTLEDGKGFELCVEYIEELPKSDPFLYLMYYDGRSHHRAYLEVWDEPGFFHKRTV